MGISWLSRGRTRMLSCTENWDIWGRFCDLDMVRSSGFNSFYGGFTRSKGKPSAGRKTIAMRREVISKTPGIVKTLKDSGMHVITYVWTGGFDRKYHDEASAEKFKGEFVGPPPTWIRDVKDYVRACYVNPDWIEEVASDVAVQMTEGGSDGIFFDVLVPLNHCVCKHCQAKFKEDTGLDLKSMPMPAFSEPAMDQTSGEGWSAQERIDFSSKDYRDYFFWRMDTFIDFFRQVRKRVEDLTGRRPVCVGNFHSSHPEYVYCITLAAGVLDGVYFEEGVNYPPNSLVYAFKAGGAAMPGAAPLVVTRVAEAIPTPSMQKVALAEGVAFGGYFTPWGYYIHESDDLEDATRQCNEFFAEHEDMLADQSDLANVALIQSLTSDIFYWQRERPAVRAMSVFLTDLHTPFEFLMAENGLDAERLGKYALLVLSNTGMVSEADLATFRAYMDAGGKIIATGDEAFCFDETMKRRDNRPEHKNLFYIAGCPEREFTDNRIIGPDYFCEFATPSGELAETIQRHATPPMIETSARTSTSINLTESDEDILVHMVNLHVNMRLSQLFIRLDRDVSLRVRVPGGVKSATLLSPDIEGGSGPIDFTQNGDYVELKIPEVKHYVIVKLQK